MAGVAVTAEIDASAVADRLALLDGVMLADITYAIGQLMETQTRTRIRDEKAGPDGEVWPAWSRAYAATRGPQHSLLVGHGSPGLLDSVQNYTTGLEARVGTPLVYGAIHQFGGEAVGKAIPARPYLGLSGENRAEIEALVVTMLDDGLNEGRA